MALVEGGILDPDDPEFGFAVNDALYGVRINRTHRLVYTRQYGLRLIDFIDWTDRPSNCSQPENVLMAVRKTGNYRRRHIC